ncbi:MAG: hypothetical protein AAGI91_11865 [Bacteroidota bacterium]
MGRSLPVLLLALGTLGCDPTVPPPEPFPVIDGVFTEDFESAERIEDLFASDGSRWTNLQRTSGSNRVELTAARSRSGRQSVRLVAEPYDGETASKADLVLERLRLRDGDRVWVEFWVWMAESGATRDVFLWDLEAPETCTDESSCPAEGTAAVCPAPGRRLYLSGPLGRSFASDLGKWCRDATFRAPAATLETERWLRVRIDLTLDSGPGGRLRVYQDDDLVLDGTGVTLPRADAVYTRMQVGITANGNNEASNEVFLDDVSVWTEPPGW